MSEINTINAVDAISLLPIRTVICIPPLTEQELEVAAKEYCSSVGLDPEAMVEDTSLPGFAYYTRPRWKSIAAELKHLDAMQRAIAYCRGNMTVT